MALTLTLKVNYPENHPAGKLVANDAQELLRLARDYFTLIFECDKATRPTLSVEIADDSEPSNFLGSTEVHSTEVSGTDDLTEAVAEATRKYQVEKVERMVKPPEPNYSYMRNKPTFTVVCNACGLSRGEHDRTIDGGGVPHVFHPQRG